MDTGDCLTTAGDVASGAGALLVFSLVGVLWVLLLERNGGVLGKPEFWRGKWTRRWNWGVLGLCGVGASVALIVALVMAVTGTTFACSPE